MLRVFDELYPHLPKLNQDQLHELQENLLFLVIETLEDALTFWNKNEDPYSAFILAASWGWLQRIDKTLFSRYQLSDIQTALTKTLDANAPQIYHSAFLYMNPGNWMARAEKWMRRIIEGDMNHDDAAMAVQELFEELDNMELVLYAAERWGQPVPEHLSVSLEEAVAWAAKHSDFFIPADSFCRATAQLTSRELDPDLELTLAKFVRCLLEIETAYREFVFYEPVSLPAAEQEEAAVPSHTMEKLKALLKSVKNKVKRRMITFVPEIPQPIFIDGTGSSLQTDKGTIIQWESWDRKKNTWVAFMHIPPAEKIAEKPIINLRIWGSIQVKHIYYKGYRKNWSRSVRKNGNKMVYSFQFTVRELLDIMAENKPELPTLIIEDIRGTLSAGVCKQFKEAETS